jgi:integrase
VRVDPHNSQEEYRRWKERNAAGIAGLSPENDQCVRRFLEDMERGMNIARGTRKGGRGYYRLGTLHTKLVWIARRLQDRSAVTVLTSVSEEELHALFGAMRSGELCTRSGRPYRSTGDYIKVFKTFWHWHMRVERKQGNNAIPDICIDLDDSTEKPPWVYLTEDDVRSLCRHAKFSYHALLLFLFDSGIRSPTELVNIRVDDLSADCTTLRIRNEVSKTFGRTINLLLCGDTLRAHIQEGQLGPTDYVFPICPAVANRYLQRLAKKVLGTAPTPGGAPYDALTLYDLRHAAACYWLPRYKSELALKYRFGWKQSTMIHYYTEFLGMTDTITANDLNISGDEKPIAQRLAQTETAKRLVEEELTILREEMKTILQTVAELARRVP